MGRFNLPKNRSSSVGKTKSGVVIVVVGGGT